MLLIHIGSITEAGLSLNEQVDAAFLPQLAVLSRERVAAFTRPIDVRIQATRVGEAVLIKGTAEARVRLLCSRCLEPFDWYLETDFSVAGSPDIPSKVESDTEDDIELTVEDMDVIAYSGDSIDLRDEIAQQVIMALPIKPLCLDACRGLCSRCGVDLNKTSCQCASQEDSNPFSVLKALHFPEKQE